MPLSIGRKKKILIADDLALNREMLTDILGAEYDYVYACDGQETIDVLSADAGVDILLLDMNMPRLSGMKVLKFMRDRNWIADTPVVIISAEDDIHFIQNAYYLGATDYIIRPFNAFLVQHRVKNTLTMYTQKRQLVKMVESQVFRREKINNMLIHIFSNIVESKNAESGSHTLHVQNITNMLLSRLVKLTDQYPLTDSDIMLISTVSALHDIGKITVPDKILNKPGKLTPEEWEIMKAHTVNGEKFLSGVSVDQNEKMIIVAREICRYHHERYDGGGYPDKLVGDAIPISAQAVSLADVYDALTGERCYKKACTHKRAVEMILNGECGVFNPVLLEAFRQIADSLSLGAASAETEQPVAEISHTLVSEELQTQSVGFGERTVGIAETEKIKKEFFAARSGGIQFEYDAILKKILYIRYYNTAGEKIYLEENVMQLIDDETMFILKSKVKQATKQNPVVTMKLRVPVGGEMRWYRAHLQTIWDRSRTSFVGVVGHFADIHEQYIRKNNDLVVDNKSIDADAVLAMQHLFDVVRFVDPVQCDVLTDPQQEGSVQSPRKCYALWDCEEPCKNCTSQKALADKQWMSKLEIKDGLVYSVLSRYVQYNGRECVLEVAFCLDDSMEKARDTIGFYADGMTLKNFYHDSLTKTYSRAYLDNFLPNLEHADGIAIADVDDFKHINDTYGHIVGDDTLRHVSNVMKSCVRDEDVLIRYGGDEFLLIFPHITEEEFFRMLGNINQAVSQSVMEKYPDVNLDISIGGAYGIHPFEKAIDTADKAMYKDKFRNKN